jgi:phosphoesterase RecJ-like protein
MTLSELEQVKAALDQAARVAIVLHELPDGDSTGSGLALRHLLEARGKSVTVLAPDPILPPYRFLPGAERQGTWASVEPLERPWDAVVTVDCGDPSRCFGMDRLRRLAPVLVNIDHHRTNSRFGDINWIDPAAVAVGEMILQLADSWGMALTPDVAVCLYVSLVMDTEGLQFGYHDARVLEQVTRLVRAGLDPEAISRQLWENRTVASLRVLGWALSHVEVSPSGRVAWIALPHEVVAATGAEPYETEGVVNYLRGLAGVQLAAFLREEAPGRVTRVSLRSRPPWEASQVAAELGGGGHPHSAGARIHAPLAEAVRLVLEAVERLYGEPVPETDSPRS